MSIREQLEKAVEKMCDEYCKMPEKWSIEHPNMGEDESMDAFGDEVCSNCPLYKLI